MDELNERLAAVPLVDRPAAGPDGDGSGGAPPGRPGPAGTAVPPRPPELSPVPLSFAQHRLWFLDRFEPGSPLYNIPVPIRIRAAVNAAALGRALNELVRRHQVLRTSFPARDGQPEQRIDPAPVVPLPVVDLRELPAPLREPAARQAYLARAREPFDLETGPPLRATLVRIGDLDSLVILVAHHIVFDGWSTPILRRELLALLEAFTAGRASPLPEPRLQYADFAVWQRRTLTGQRLASLLDYWRGKVTGAPVELPLPYDRARLRITHFAGATRGFEVPGEIANALRKLVRAEGATLFMGLLAGFSVLLHRYTGEDDIVVGTTVAGRTRSELEPLIGFFVNSLVLRNDLSGRPSLRTVLRQVKDTCLDAYAHQELPFERLVEELRPERHLSRNPMFQVAVIVQNLPGPRDSGDPTAPVDTRHVSGTAKFDLTVALAEAGERLRGAIEYSTDLFDASTIDRLVDHFVLLLDGLLSDPDRCVDDIGVLTPAERRERDRWSGVGSGTDRGPDRGPDRVGVPDFRPLPRILADAVARTPDATAVEAPDGILTYAGLADRCYRLAHLLRRRGIGTDDVVALCLERSLDSVVAILGTLAAGAAILPLDPSHPPARLGYMIERSGTRLILAHRGLGTPLPDGVDVMCLDAGGPELAGQPTTPPPVEIHPEQLAWVVFTSGSTGRPKGVLVPHRGTGGLAAGIAGTFAAAPSDRVLQFASLSFDASLFEIILALGAGATLVVERQADLLPGADLTRLLARRRVTIGVLSPSALSAMASGDLPDLASVVFAGEASSPELVARWGRDHTVFNAYGPTETTIAATLGPWAGTGGLPLGRPVPGTRIHLLDRYLSPVPPNCPGEMYIGGAGVARGYAEQPDHTAERYVPDPFSDEPGARMYRTGDLARFRNGPDGPTLEFLGRVDDQVKLRGFRIEPREVAAALAAYPGVRDAVVILRRDGAGGEGLVGYLATDHPPPVAKLRDFLRERLPEYMLPAAYVFLPALPLTRSGKVDRAALPAPDRLGSDRRDLVAPRTSLERRITAIWCEVLGLPEAGVTDNFFDFGGHSLLATKLLDRTAGTLRVALSLRDLFLDPTVAGLAAAVEAARVAGAPQPPPPAVPQPRGRPLPMSYAQERLWFLDRLEPGSAFYSIPLTLRLRGRVDRAALAAAFTAIATRHEVLRTTFQLRDGVPVQVVAALADVPLAHHDLSSQPVGERELSAARLIQEETRRPFDLGTGPLLRTTLVTLGPAEHLLLVNVHHIVADGWSAGILVGEVNTAYPALATGAPFTLPELPVQYADFAIWQRDWLRGEVLTALVDWWRAELRGAPPVLELPADRPRPAVQLHRGASHSFLLPGTLAREVHALARREGATVFMLLLAAFAVLLRRYSGADDIVVGTPVAGRRPEVEKLVGLFVNTLPLRCDLTGRPSFRELLERVRETTLAGYAHQDLPFEQLVEALQPERDLSHNPIFQVMFAWQDLPGLAAPSVDAREAPPPEEPRPSASGSGTAKFDLTLFMTGSAHGLRAAFEYDTDLFDADRITRMASHLGMLLRSVVSDPDAPVDALPLLEAGERDRMVLVGGPLDDQPETPDLIHKLVEDQVRRTPHAVAVEDGPETLTYAELDRQAAVLAATLRRRGVGPDVVVGVAVPRGSRLIVALLAILKAGGAFLPVDADHPPARVARQLRRSRTRLVVVAGARDDPPEWGVEVLPLGGPETSDPETSDPGTSDPGPLTGDHLAYVIYTSGSTGEPKGVMNAHAPVSNRLRWMRRANPLGPTDAVLHKTPVTFDVSVWEIFWPLCSGARLVIARPGGHRDPQYLVDLVASRKVTVAHFVPSMLPAFLDRPDVERCTSLRHIYCSGEALGADLAARAVARLGVEVHNMYGPTEAAIEVSHWHYRPDPAAHRVPIGVPLPNARLVVLDRELRPVPPGVPGELYLGGLPVARGYQAAPDLTADRFVPDPFGPPGSRMYRSGDRALVRPDGAVEYLGRLDSQIKLRGIRIEPGEIEARLRTHPRVADAVVVVRGDGAAEQRLVAYLAVPGADPAGDAALADELRGHLRPALPEYLLPAAYVRLDALPLGRSGKVDRAALPEPSGPVTRAGRQPSTVLERDVAAIWGSVLRVPALDLSARFFEIGGNSLLATQVTARVNQAMGVDLPLRALFEAPTLGDFVASVSSAAAQPPEQLDPIGPVVALDEAGLLARIDELSDEEVEALLARLEDDPPRDGAG